MRLNEYQQLALRTECPEAPKALTPTQFRLLHGAIGICTEVGELVESQDDEDNTKQEIGDCFWYCAILCDAMMDNLENLDWSHLPIHQDPLDGLVIYSSNILDKLKRHIYYSKELEAEEISNNLCLVVKHLVILVDEYGFELEDVLERNIDKLRLRYPERFSSERAINRDVKNESIAFE